MCQQVLLSCTANIAQFDIKFKATISKLKDIKILTNFTQIKLSWRQQVIQWSFINLKISICCQTNSHTITYSVTYTLLKDSYYFQRYNQSIILCSYLVSYFSCLQSSLKRFYGNFIYILHGIYGILKALKSLLTIGVSSANELYDA